MDPQEEALARLKVSADQCILWGDRALKQWHEHGDEPLSNEYWEQYKSADWFGYHVLDILVIYTRTFDTPRNRQDAPFFELKHEIFRFQHNLILQLLQVRNIDHVLINEFYELLAIPKNGAEMINLPYRELNHLMLLKYSSSNLK